MESDKNKEFPELEIASLGVRLSKRKADVENMMGGAEGEMIAYLRGQADAYSFAFEEIYGLMIRLGYLKG